MTRPLTPAQQARIAAGYTLEQAADACRAIGRPLSPSTLDGYERGYDTFPFCHVKRLAELYQCDYGAFNRGRNQAQKQKITRRTKNLKSVATSTSATSRKVGTTERTVNEKEKPGVLPKSTPG